MTQDCSNDLRERLVFAVEEGMAHRSAAKRFGVSSVDGDQMDRPVVLRRACHPSAPRRRQLLSSHGSPCR